MKHLSLQDRLYSNVFFFGRVTGLPFFLLFIPSAFYFLDFS
ncbi:hypothetical protein CHCC20375_0700 [Bacillus licheniformis]|nr:hypothetical protein CHCC5022_0390 [Bacillus paralicheniformis]TWJ83151.1 hypothetical protein CHCC4186_0508 [Bacillus paralicheniformis]TWK15197.1 hypothetical protein CHCC20375_0700 [Bacillus licheniformis]TWM19766.1 hypothetical protein CHCC14821_2316 [Bacillus paralicheniformis]TWM64109.1 hypothetical protein CHCC14814_4470 [Bacillus paralicheniformis]